MQWRRDSQYLPDFVRKNCTWIWPPDLAGSGSSYWFRPILTYSDRHNRHRSGRLSKYRKSLSNLVRQFRQRRSSSWLLTSDVCFEKRKHYEVEWRIGLHMDLLFQLILMLRNEDKWLESWKRHWIGRNSGDLSMPLSLFSPTARRCIRMFNLEGEIIPFCFWTPEGAIWPDTILYLIFIEQMLTESLCLEIRAACSCQVLSNPFVGVVFWCIDNYQSDHLFDIGSGSRPVVTEATNTPVKTHLFENSWSDHDIGLGCERHCKHVELCLWRDLA